MFTIIVIYSFFFPAKNIFQNIAFSLLWAFYFYTLVNWTQTKMTKKKRPISLTMLLLLFLVLLQWLMVSFIIKTSDECFGHVKKLWFLVLIFCLLHFPVRIFQWSVEFLHLHYHRNLEIKFPVLNHIKILQNDNGISHQKDQKFSKWVEILGTGNAISFYYW